MNPQQFQTIESLPEWQRDWATQVFEDCPDWTLQDLIDVRQGDYEFTQAQITKCTNAAHRHSLESELQALENWLEDLRGVQ